ncbi:hypothetical protein KME66_19345 [Streptomyces sp. YPW6]|uniref:hypothetical protein n=1 Tax=Streptomyces sp. YPW6 TaxID=2840373 RepID=UPI001C0D0A52|nr:hypothetical protein [Streptomyces sp. YPW6]QWQ42898.1 hypothetical protein KME66_19345 [Streptomyces sp. YPW6]
MRHRIALVALTAGLFSLTALPASATAASPGSGAGQECTDVKLSGELPLPPAGMAVRQQVTIGPDCTPVPGAVRLVPSSAAPAVAASSRTAAETRQVRSRSEMYDCCNIRMTGLYTTSDWSFDGTAVTASATDATQEWNREPWNAGWSLKSSGKSADCLAGCPVSVNAAQAEFSYQGVFDPTGVWYANKHSTTVTLKADGTASCEFDVELKHSFVGWNWQRGCE